MIELLIAAGIQLFGVTLAGCLQLFLKKSAMQEHDRFWKRYFNWKVLLSYCGMLISVFCTIIALRFFPLSMVAIWSAYSQVLVFLLSAIILKEKITKRKVLGLIIIIIGIVTFFADSLITLSNI